ncbi:MAG TPA: energy transducer TonB [Candidatus Binatia bacterium]|nr:energy transducer TonB [Candidatus Binatia bacterium]
MIAVDPFPSRPKLDDPWRRLPWLTPTALVLWGALLIGFTWLLQDTGRSPEPITRLDARLIELPASEPGGLQGGAQPAPPPETAPPVPQPQPRIEPKKAQAPAVRVKKQKPVAPRLYDSRGAHTAPAAEVEGAAANQPSDAGAANAFGAGASGRAGAGGLGSDSVGARAIYAPPPKIPDDLREHVFETVAVAHFHVTFDGNATVSLIQPTSNPRLNLMVLDTLKQWRFFPAIRNGVAIDSEFDVRIPIAVRDQ